MSWPSVFDQVPYFLYGTAWKGDDTQRCVEEAVAAGFRGIDTANQARHYYEAGVGSALASLYEKGSVSREELFLQTKFTPQAGQDHRLPYDPDASYTDQVRQSFDSSCDHLGTQWLDSYVLHGPLHPRQLGSGDWEIWHAMEALQREGRVRHLGISNVNLVQLRELVEQAEIKPSFVQNRCFARTGWDQEIRLYCRYNDLVYQGFSLLTANGDILRDNRFTEIVTRQDMTPAQVVFTFARQVGMLALTGTTQRRHMDEDLQTLEWVLSERDVDTIERLAAD